MSSPRTPAQRTAAARAALNAVASYPIVRVNPSAPPTAPRPFDGLWLHSTSVGPQILSGGWKPDLVSNTIYGAAVYLSRQKWNAQHPHVISCMLDLQAADVISSFASPSETGATQNHFLWHLKDNGLVVGRNASPGTSTQNQKIAQYFKARAIKAAWLTEHGTEIVVVYDPACIRVV